MTTLILMVGMPCSGKSTWIRNNKEKLMNRYKAKAVITISRDDIRDSMAGLDYIFTRENENAVTDKFYKQMRQVILIPDIIIILDNCNTTKEIIDGFLTIIKPLIASKKLRFYIKNMKVSLWKARIRNWLRRKKTGKYIPPIVLEAFFREKRFLNLQEYKQYIYFE